MSAATGVTPAVNQVEWSPFLFDRPALEEHRTRKVVLEGYSGLKNGVLDHPEVRGIAESRDRTPAQVVIRWHLQHSIVVIPKSVTPSRMAENLAVFDFELDQDQMQALSHLNRGEGGRTGPNPDAFDYVPG